MLYVNIQNIIKKDIRLLNDILLIFYTYKYYISFFIAFYNVWLVKKVVFLSILGVITVVF